MIFQITVKYSNKYVLNDVLNGKICSKASNKFEVNWILNRNIIIKTD